MSTLDQNVAVVQKIYDAFVRSDVPTILSCVVEDATWSAPYGQGVTPWARNYKGHSEILEFFKAVAETVEVHHFQVRETIAQGNKVVALVDWSGRAVRSGKTFEMLLVHIWTLENGKVVDYIGPDDPLAY